MKKTLVAIASLAAVSAFAQSSVSITGNIDAGFQANTYKGVNVSGIANNGASTSTIQLNGVEDLGGGLRATFKLNSDFNPTAGQGNAGYGGVATGQSAGITSTTGVAGSSGSWLNSEMKFGLAGGFGEIYTGVVNNLTLDAGGTGNPFGTAIGSGFRALYNTDVIGILGTSGTAGSIVRHDHAFLYVTPSFNGLTASIYNVKKNDASTTDAFSTTFGNYDRAGVDEYNVKYNQGPINLSMTNQKQTGVGLTQLNASTGVLVDTKLQTLGANYALGNAKFFFMNQTSKVTSTSSNNASYRSAGATYTMGAITWLAQAGSLTNKSVTTGDNKSTLIGLGADYALSKRTSLYGRYESIADKSGYVINPSKLTAVSGDTTRVRSAIGIRHTF
jgi:predicted porin